MKYRNRIWLLAVFAFLFSCSNKSAPSRGKNKDILTVMTYNVHHCNPPGKPGVIDVDAIAAVIKKEQADVVAVQEVDVNTGRSGGINQAALLAQKAGYPSFYFARAMDFDGGQYGLLILSRYPLSDTRTYPLPSDNPQKDEPRILATSTVTLPDGSAFRFGSTHLEAYNPASRLLQIKEINRIADEMSLPFIVAGDLNAEEKSEVITTLDQDFVRTCSNCPDTFDEEKESGAIDYIAFKKKASFTVVSHRVVQNKEASDHMPVIAALRLK